jgi:DNA replication protein DnaC
LAAAAAGRRRPIGLALQGQRGTGKTHMLGWVREQVHARGGYFFLVSLLDAEGGCSQ